MAYRKRKLNTSIFLMEMIVICGFLCLSAGLCIKGFVKAHELSKYAEDKGKAIIIAQGYAEEFKGIKFDNLQEMNIQINYDKDWNETKDEKEIKYYCKMILEHKENRMLRELNIEIYNKNDELLYDLYTGKLGDG